MSNNQRQSYSFTLRACPSDTNIIELIDYLRSLGRSVANRKIEDALIKTMLSLAKQHSGKYSPQELKLSCLNSCDALTSHSNYLRQTFNVIDPQLTQLYPSTFPQPVINSSNDLNRVNTLSTQVNQSIPRSPDNKVKNPPQAQNIEDQTDENDYLSSQTEDLVARPSEADKKLLDTAFNF